jgi:hypothetical protein
MRAAVVHSIWPRSGRDAGQNLEQSFAGAVLADAGMRFAFVDGEVTPDSARTAPNDCGRL